MILDAVSSNKLHQKATSPTLQFA